MTDVASLGEDGFNDVLANTRKNTPAASRLDNTVALKRPKGWTPSANDDQDRDDIVRALVKFRGIFDNLSGDDGGLRMQQELRWNELANLLANMGYIRHANDIIAPESRFKEDEPSWKTGQSSLPVRIEPARHNISYILPGKDKEEERNLFDLLHFHIGQTIENNPKKNYDQGLFGAFLQDLKQIVTYKPDPRFPKNHQPVFIAERIPAYKPAPVPALQPPAPEEYTPMVFEIPVASAQQLAAQQIISTELQQFRSWWDEQNAFKKGKLPITTTLKWPNFFYHFDHKGFAQELGAGKDAPRFETPSEDANETIRYIASEKVPTFKKSDFNIKDADGETHNLFDLLALYLQDTKDVRATEKAFADEEEKDFYAQWEQYAEDMALADPDEEKDLIPVVAPEQDERSYAPRHAKQEPVASAPTRRESVVPSIGAGGRTPVVSSGSRVPAVNSTANGTSALESWGRQAGDNDVSQTAKQPSRLKRIFATAGHVVTTGVATYLVTSTSRIAIAGGLVALGAPAIPAAVAAGAAVGLGMVGYRYLKSGSKVRAGFGVAATAAGVTLGAFGLEAVSEPLAKLAEAGMGYLPEPVRNQLIAMSTPVGQGIQKASTFVGLQFDGIKNRFFDWTGDALDASRTALKEQIHNLLQTKQSQALEIASLKQQLAFASASLAGDQMEASGDAITKRIVEAFTSEPNPDGSIPASALPVGFGADNGVSSISSFNDVADTMAGDAVGAVNRLASLSAAGDAVEGLLPYAGSDTVGVDIPASDYTDYAVRKNDSLFKIGAREYGLRRGDLLDWAKQTIALNPELAADPDALDRGQHLKLPLAHTDLPMADCNDTRLLKGYRNPCRVPSIS